ncbi:unnamed protein product [Heligmosomoides polygyrus]|uniref:Macro domain-containing protein n=1 Tax=Heligmosomoides polygyrus TaxID=6339 RepID=A0A183G2B7_HELPZ|nr:unnamed protein product [Heligmosomoides polygyrus]
MASRGDGRYDEDDLLQSSADEHSDQEDVEMEQIGKAPDKGIETLRQQVEAMGTDAIPNAGKSNEPLLSGLVDIEAISPEVLRAYADQRLRQQWKGAISAGHRWEGSYCIVEALEMSAEAEAYEKVKEAALRLERSRSVTQEIIKTSHRDKEFRDTGSEISIVPARLLKRMGHQGVNLDLYVERIDAPKVNIRDASGNVMKMFDTIKVATTLNGQTESISFFVAQGLDEIVVLGTNALDLFGFRLTRSQTSEIAPQSTENTPLADESENDQRAPVKERVYISPGRLCTLTLTGVQGAAEALLWSSHALVSHGVCAVSTEVFVGPTINKALHRSSWLKLASTFAKAALGGAKVVAVAPPRGELAWKQSRIDTREMMDVARTSAMSMKNNIICMIPLVESTAEPFQTVGLHPRPSSEDPYPRVVVQDFMAALKEFVQCEIPISEAVQPNVKTSGPRRDKDRQETKDYLAVNQRRGIHKRPHGISRGRHYTTMFPNAAVMMTPPCISPQLSFMPQFGTSSGRGRGKRGGRGRGGYKL